MRVGGWIMASEKHMGSKGKEKITRELIVNGGPEWAAQMASLLRAFSAPQGPDLCPQGVCSLMAPSPSMVLKGDSVTQQQILTKDCSGNSLVGR